MLFLPRTAGGLNPSIHKKKQKRRAFLSMKEEHSGELFSMKEEHSAASVGKVVEFFSFQGAAEIFNQLGFHIHEIDAYGSCLFRSLSHQIHGNEDRMNDTYCRRIVAYMRV